MQDAFDHPGRRRRKRSPTGAPQALNGDFSRWKAQGKDYRSVGEGRGLAMLVNDRTEGKGAI